ncbi:hypothetical protein PSQ90_16465 [Devosia rhodophyticola]|uniref:Uncharacterized protein n=1 Tax=Devosia rhodophyticola TaxID=3026423 RepID=A0ABY7YXS1_9HYPH|nr:hypothetical protein [Devosia rhodophyticola]WDR05815.1 hypothetical protein PSQ90_16465 [Devosia rhodophyticola]
MIKPYGSVGRSIPVRVLGKGQLANIGAETAFIRVTAEAGHSHAAGESCIACAGRLDIRARLFEVLEEVRQGLRAPVADVVVDASALVEIQPILDAIAGRLPATAMRDHTVARVFYLVDAI